MRVGDAIRWVVAGVALLGAVVGAADAPPPVVAARVRANAETLLATPHRLAGSAEGRAAGDAILSALRAAGVPDDAVLVQPFPVTQLRLAPDDCYAERDGVRTPMQPLRPNVLALPVTPPDGLEAATVYLADGAWERFTGRELAGRIAVFDYRCGDRWRRALAGNAAAIVFVGDAPEAAALPPAPDPRRWAAAHLEIPRFFLPREAAHALGLFDGARVRLFCRMSFAPGVGRNIFVLVPGTAPDEKTARELLGLAGHYDSFGPLPFATPAPDTAANVAGLIEAAAAFARAPRSRGLLIAFFDNAAQEQRGEAQFLVARFTYQNGASEILRFLVDSAILAPFIILKMFIKKTFI